MDPTQRTAPEPWRIKVVEPIRLPSEERRRAALEEAGYNVFRLRAEDVFIDLLTDSGTGAMSAEQWAALFSGDESYAGARSWYRLEETVQKLTGCRYVLPVHQGRAAEAIYCRAFVSPGDLVLGNLHFDTTRAHIASRGGQPVDVVAEHGLDPKNRSPFKGDVDLQKAERIIRDNPGRVRLFILTVTANTNGGQPVSLSNAKAVAELCRRHALKLIIDAARFPENCWLIREREAGQAGRSVEDLSRELLSLGDGVAMSAKKAALVNIGGFLALRSESDFKTCQGWAILNEGYLTYGGMAGRDLEALARGLVEGLDEEFLASRIRQVRLLHSLLDEAGVPVLQPPGGHSVVIDAAQFLSHLPREQFPAESLVCALYLKGGIRAVGHGALAFGERDPSTGRLKPPRYENVRLAIPRRVYTDNHLRYVAEVICALWAERERIGGLRPVDIPEQLALFTARLAPA